MNSGPFCWARPAGRTCLEVRVLYGPGKGTVSRWQGLRGRPWVRRKPDRKALAGRTGSGYETLEEADDSGLQAGEDVKLRPSRLGALLDSFARTVG